jgi:hypothetical protein
MCVQVAARSRLLPACIALEGSRREVRFDNLNAICMKVPVLYVLGRTEPELRNLRRMRLICSFDIERSLADFRFTSIVSENILQEPSDVLCHGNLLIVCRDSHKKFSRIHVEQALAVAKDDLSGAGKPEYPLAVQLGKCP